MFSRHLPFLLLAGLSLLAFSAAGYASRRINFPAVLVFLAL